MTQKVQRGARAIPLAAFLALTISVPAMAQLYPGDDVQVNPGAIPRPTLHRHGKHALPPDSSGVIHLHMPRSPQARVAKSVTAHAPETASAAPPSPPAAPKKKTVATTATAPSQTKPASDDMSWGVDSPVAQQPAARSAPAKKQVKSAVAPPKPPRVERRAAAVTAPAGPPPATSDSGDMPFSFETPGGQQPSSPAAAPSPSAKSVARSSSQKAPKVASLERPPAETVSRAKPDKAARPVTHTGQTKQGEILFAAGGTDPDAGSYQEVKSLATAVNSALGAGSGGVEVDAYGGPPGDKSSDARRLSLRRALAVRQLLIDNGVPADRINVHALGGIEDQGKPDRVDVYVGASKSG